MTIEAFRRITVKGSGANEKHAPVYLSSGDDNGRILRFALTNNGASVNGSSLSCRFLFDQGAGLYQDMTYVSGESTATWECKVATGGLTPGLHNAAFEVTDSDGGIVCTRTFTAVVEPGVLQDGEQSSEMQDALSDFEERVQAALEASTELIHITENLSASVNSSGVLIVTDINGTTTSYNVASLVHSIADTPAANATSAATSANNAASAANTAAGLANTAYNTANTAITELASYVPISAGNILSRSLNGTDSAPVIAADAFTRPLLGATVQGHSTQGANPSPSSPQEIKSLAGAVLKIAGGNIRPLPALPQTSGGVTFSVGDNGTLLANGTPSAFTPSANVIFTLQPGTYTLSGPTNGGANVALVQITRRTDNVVVATSYNSANPVTFTLEDASEVIFRYHVYQAHGAYTNFVFDVMLNAGSTALPYTPYVTPSTTSLIPSTVAPLRSLPDGTHDTLVINRDGSGTITRNVGTVTFDGSDDESWLVESGSSGYVRFTVQNVSGTTRADQSLPASACNRLTLTAQGGTATPNATGYAITAQSAVFVIIQGTDSSITTVAQFKSWLASHQLNITFKLATPTTETIPAIAMPSIPSQYLTAWVEGEDQNGAAITADYGITYERSLNVAWDNIIHRFGLAEDAFEQAGIIVDLDSE